MTRAEPSTGLAAHDAPMAPPIAEAVAKPSIERLAGVRILRGGAGWHGVSLRVGQADGDRQNFDLSLVTVAGHSIRIACLEEDEVVAAWRSLSRDTGLPMLVEQADGTLASPYPQLGRLALGSRKIRRAHGALRQRRPRFLVRRKAARLADLPVVHLEAPVIDALGSR